MKQAPRQDRAGTSGEIGGFRVQGLGIAVSQSGEADWQDYAVCKQIGAEPFIGDNESSRSDSRTVHLSVVRRVCGGCAVAEACMTEAVDEGFLGLWAGSTEEQREHIRKLPDLHKRKIAITEHIAALRLVASTGTGITTRPQEGGEVLAVISSHEIDPDAVRVIMTEPYGSEEFVRAATELLQLKEYDPATEISAADWLTILRNVDREGETLLSQELEYAYSRNSIRRKLMDIRKRMGLLDKRIRDKILPPNELDKILSLEAGGEEFTLEACRLLGLPYNSSSRSKLSGSEWLAVFRGVFRDSQKVRVLAGRYGVNQNAIHEKLNSVKSRLEKLSPEVREYILQENISLLDLEYGSDDQYYAVFQKLGIDVTKAKTGVTSLDWLVIFQSVYRDGAKRRDLARAFTITERNFNKRIANIKKQFDNLTPEEQQLILNMK
jgi:hypothetical protein